MDICCVCCVCASVQCAVCGLLFMQMNVKCQPATTWVINKSSCWYTDWQTRMPTEGWIHSKLFVCGNQLQTRALISPKKIKISKSATSYQSANQKANQWIRMQISKPESQTATGFKSATSCKSANPNPNADQQTRKHATTRPSSHPSNRVPAAESRKSCGRQFLQICDFYSFYSICGANLWYIYDIIDESVTRAVDLD